MTMSVKKTNSLYERILKTREINELCAELKSSGGEAREDWHQIEECLEAYTASICRKAQQSEGAGEIYRSPEFNALNRLLDEVVRPHVRPEQEETVRSAVRP